MKWTAVARPGWPLVLLAAGLAIGIQYTVSLVAGLPLWLLSILLGFCFRDPVRSVPSVPLAIVSPVDGCVVAIRHGEDNFVGRKTWRICLRINRLGAYVLRSPIEGKILKRWLRGANSTAESTNHVATWIQTDEGDDVVLVAYRGMLRYGHQWHAQEGERIGQGQRYGILPFGSRVDLLIPENARVETQPGQALLAGSSIIAEFVH